MNVEALLGSLIGCHQEIRPDIPAKQMGTDHGPSEPTKRGLSPSGAQLQADLQFGKCESKLDSFVSFIAIDVGSQKKSGWLKTITDEASGYAKRRQIRCVSDRRRRPIASYPSG